MHPRLNRLGPVNPGQHAPKSNAGSIGRRQGQALRAPAAALTRLVSQRSDINSERTQEIVEIVLLAKHLFDTMPVWTCCRDCPRLSTNSRPLTSAR